MPSRTSKKSSKKTSKKKSSSESAKGGAGRSRLVLASKSAAMFPLTTVSGGDLDRFVEAKDALSEQLLHPRGFGPRGAVAFAVRRPAASPAPEDNLSGVGIGEKISGGRHTGIMAVKFLVRIKYPYKQILYADRLPTEGDGHPVDVEQVGNFRRFMASSSAAATAMPNSRKEIRTAPPGC